MKYFTSVYTERNSSFVARNINCSIIDVDNLAHVSSLKTRQTGCCTMFGMFSFLEVLSNHFHNN